MHERRALCALFAVFALMVQALIPAAAMARPGSEGAQVICTAMGAETLAAHGQPAPHKGFGGMPCQDCLAAAMACVTTPELAVLPVAYAVARVEHVAAAPALEPRARAPPRPPGQGPPTA
jgi:hypothetical protein